MKIDGMKLLVPQHAENPIDVFVRRGHWRRIYWDAYEGHAMLAGLLPLGAREQRQKIYFQNVPDMLRLQELKIRMAPRLRSLVDAVVQFGKIAE
jgi:hypothetical protein